MARIAWHDAIAPLKLEAGAEGAINVLSSHSTLTLAGVPTALPALAGLENLVKVARRDDSRPCEGWPAVVAAAEAKGSAPSPSSSKLGKKRSTARIDLRGGWEKRGSGKSRRLDAEVE